MAKVSIIVLGYNKSDHTLACLESLTKLAYSDFDVIVVDNASDVQHLKAVEYWIESRHDSRFMLHASQENLGYSGGNNLGIKKALGQGSEYVLILNNDVVVEPNFIESLLEADKDIVGVERGNIRFFKTELPLQKESSNGIDLTHFEYLSGLAFLVKRKVFEKIGLFDERYFLYFEDVDFSIKAFEAGFSLCIVRARYTHSTSATSSSLGAATLLYYHTRNALLFNKNFGPWWMEFALPFWRWGFKIEQHIKIFLGKNVEISRAILQGVKDFERGIFGQRKNGL